MSVVLEGVLTPADRRRSPYRYLPFEVPAGTTRLEVGYRYDPGNIVDIGLLDPTLEPFPSRRGFRGWSGGARAGFFLGRNAATPGYLAGEIPAGRWQVLLGLARIAAERCRYRVEIRFDAAPRPLLAPPRAAPPPPSAAGWYRGDLQAHTHHSDARGSLPELIEAARHRGLDFLAVTDHNTVSHHREISERAPADLLLIPGEEVTTYRGHANVWGVDGWVDFRIERDADLDRLVSHVHERGGLFSVNHPKRSPECIGCDWEYPLPEAIDCLEAWQGPWAYRNWESVARYDALLRGGRRVTLVGGSDRHQPGWPDPDPELLQVGTPTTWLELDELSVAGVIAALRAGRCCVGESPAGPRLEIALSDPAGAQGGRDSGVVRMGDRYRGGGPVDLVATVTGGAGGRLRWVGSGGSLREVAIAGDAFEDRWRWTPAGAFVRAEVIAPHDDRFERGFAELERLGRLPPELRREEVLGQRRVRALSNPIYLAPDVSATIRSNTATRSGSN